MDKNNIVAEDFERWRREEYDYLDSLRAEPDEDAMSVAYVESLIALEEGQ